MKCHKHGAEILKEGDCGAALTADSGPSTQSRGGEATAVSNLDRTTAARGGCGRGLCLIRHDEIPDGECKLLTAMFADIKVSMEVMENSTPPTQSEVAELNRLHRNDFIMAVKLDSLNSVS